jgi:ribosomal protein S18 acetylase RimI-like enzyme
MKRVKSVDHIVTEKYHNQHTAAGLGMEDPHQESVRADCKPPQNSFHSPSLFYITKVRTAEDLSAISSLFIAYTKWLDIDLAYQDFTSELANLPGKYAPPTGELLLARATESDLPVGCAALRPLFPPDCCEMKRLYVAPEGRGMGVGKALAKEVLAIAKDLRYAEIRLDTLPHMKAAVGLYTMFGFVRCAKYYETPIEGTVFLSKRLQ